MSEQSRKIRLTVTGQYWKNVEMVFLERKKKRSKCQNSTVFLALTTTLKQNSSQKQVVYWIAVKQKKTIISVA